MSKGDRTKKDRNRVSVDGNEWVAMPCVFLGSRACAELSPLATKMLLALMGQLRRGGYGNGRIDAHPERMRALGWTSAASRHQAIRELMDANLLVCTRQGAKGRLALYGITLWPMHCNHDNLDVGPGAWRVDDWRSKPRAEATPTRQDPATWNRPRKAERRKRTSRSGNALAPCVPVAGTELPQTPACIPAAGTHRGVSAENAFPQRDLLSREPSAGGLQPPAGMGVRMGRLLAARVRHGLQPGYDTARMRRMPSDGCAPQGMCATDATVDAMTPTPA